MRNNKIDFFAVGRVANEIADRASGAYWLEDMDDTTAVIRVDRLEKETVARFEKLALMLGYRVERIEVPAVTEAA